MLKYHDTLRKKTILFYAYRMKKKWQKTVIFNHWQNQDYNHYGRIYIILFMFFNMYFIKYLK